jgi:hypothetical protein
MSHILEHPEMKGQEPRIADILGRPDVVVQSSSDTSVRMFYRFYKNTSVGDKFLCAIVKYGQDRSFVITAYFTDKVKKGDELWKR